MFSCVSLGQGCGLEGRPVRKKGGRIQRKENTGGQASENGSEGCKEQELEQGIQLNEETRAEDP